MLHFERVRRFSMSRKFYVDTKFEHKTGMYLLLTFPPTLLINYYLLATFNIIEKTWIDDSIHQPKIRTNDLISDDQL